MKTLVPLFLLCHFSVVADQARLTVPVYAACGKRTFYSSSQDKMEEKKEITIMGSNG